MIFLILMPRARRVYPGTCAHARARRLQTACPALTPISARTRSLALARTHTLSRTRCACACARALHAALGMSSACMMHAGRVRVCVPMRARAHVEGWGVWEAGRSGVQACAHVQAYMRVHVCVHAQAYARAMCVRARAVRAGVRACVCEAMMRA